MSFPYSFLSISSIGMNMREALFMQYLTPLGDERSP